MVLVQVEAMAAQEQAHIRRGHLRHQLVMEVFTVAEEPVQDM